jgi:hypothetical protein
MVHFRLVYTLIPILFGAGLTLAACAGAGRGLLRRLGAKLYRGEEWLYGFVAGAAVLSLLVFLAAAAGLARPGVFLLLAAVCILAGIRPGRAQSIRLPDFPWSWKALFAALFVPFTVLYLAQALGPEYSPDGSSYHLGYVARYLRQGGFGHITTSIYANLTQGLEMLFLFAFAFGQHSTAAAVHFGLLLALVCGIVAYARRFGFPAAGICAALLIYLSPVFGFDGTAAYNDVAAGCVTFFLFYALEIWDARRQTSLLVVAGLLAGFAYAIKYTAFLAVPYAIGFVLWKSRRPRPAVVVALCAALMIVPWMAKNWVEVGNPVSPFLNRWFPNPYTNAAWEQDYARGNGIHRDGFRWSAAVTDVTVRGHLSRSLLGPVFLLAPLGLGALAWREGRRWLLAAGIFALPWLANVDTRFLIPATPFAALAMGRVLMRWRWTIPLLLIVHAYLSWPTVARRYCDPLAMRVQHFLPREALRKVPEEVTLAYRLPDYKAMRMVERLVPPQGRVFTFNAVPLAYTSREVLVAWEASSNEAIKDMLLMPLRPEMKPEWRWRFNFPRKRVTAVRVVETGRDPGAQWSVGELHVFDSGREVTLTGLTAHPNPWDAGWAIDRNPLTRWRSLEPMRPGMYLEARFGEAREIDAVALDCAHDQWGMQLRVEAEESPGHWQLLPADPVQSEDPPPPDLRAAAVRELKRRGITHLLIRDTDFGAADFRSSAAGWGLDPVGQVEEWRVYAIRHSDASAAR